MFVHNRIPNFAPRCMRARSDACRRRIVSRQHLRARRHLVFDLSDNLLRLDISPVDHQPTRTFRNPSTKENHYETQRRADSKRAAPSQPDWQPPRIKQHKSRPGTKRCPEPVGTVDQQIDATAYTRRNQFVDGGIDCCVFAADARPCERAEKSVARKTPGESG